MSPNAVPLWPLCMWTCVGQICAIKFLIAVQTTSLFSSWGWIIALLLVKKNKCIGLKHLNEILCKQYSTSKNIRFGQTPVRQDKKEQQRWWLRSCRQTCSNRKTLIVECWYELLKRSNADLNTISRVHCYTAQHTLTHVQKQTWAQTPCCHDWAVFSCSPGGVFFLSFSSNPSILDNTAWLWSRCEAPTP